MWISFTIGLCSGIMSSVIFWLVTTILLRPKLRISKDIQIITQTDGTTLYKLKIQNQGFKRNVYDIRTYIRIRYRGTFLSIELPTIPVLKCKGRGKHKFDNERLLPFNLSDIRAAKINGFKDTVLKRKYESKQLTLNDFEDKDTRFETVLIAYDEISNASCKVLILDYDFKQMIAAASKGLFEPGSLKLTRDTTEGTSNE
ncbi:MAG: hypothetical protein K2N13_02055 [Paraprevotella sp.]|nr:hypothetical protein [Paraprevotella sp.]